MFGRQPHGPTEASLAPWKPTKTQGKETAEQLQTLLHNAFESVRSAQVRAEESNSAFPSTSTTFATGEYVWIKANGQDRSHSEALRPHWQGPFEVLSSTAHTLQLKNCYNGKVTRAHTNNVKKFQGTAPRLLPASTTPQSMGLSTYQPTKEQPLSHLPTGVAMDPSPLQPDEYEVEEILSERQDNHGKPEYLVKWRGYPTSANTWEPAHNFINKNGARTLALINWKNSGRHEGIYQIIWGLEETNQRFSSLPRNLGRPAGTAASKERGVSHQ